MLIFEDDADRREFLRILKRCTTEERMIVHAWCLMDNHFHLVVDAHDCDFSKTIQRIEIGYASYFNRVHQRDGHLFQGPFYSVPIETDAQLMATIHYVHDNPAKARICPAREYRWSSLQEYLGKHYVVSTDLALALFGGIDGMLAFGGDPQNVRITYANSRSMSDQEILAVAVKLFGDDAPAKLKSGSRQERDAIIRALADNSASLRSLARLSGLSRRMVSRIVSK